MYKISNLFANSIDITCWPHYRIIFNFAGAFYAPCFFIYMELVNSLTYLSIYFWATIYECTMMLISMWTNCSDVPFNSNSDSVIYDLPSIQCFRFEFIIYQDSSIYFTLNWQSFIRIDPFVMSSFTARLTHFQT